MKYDKQDEKQNKSLINHLAKTISDNSKVLAEFGMDPPIIDKIKSIISLDVSTTSDNGNQKLTNDVKDESIQSNPYIRLKLEYPDSAIFPPIDNMDHNNEHDNKEELLTEEYDPNRVF